MPGSQPLPGWVLEWPMPKSLAWGQGQHLWSVSHQLSDDLSFYWQPSFFLLLFSDSCPHVTWIMQLCKSDSSRVFRLYFALLPFLYYKANSLFSDWGHLSTFSIDRGRREGNGGERRGEKRMWQGIGNTNNGKLLWKKSFRASEQGFWVEYNLTILKYLPPCWAPAVVNSVGCHLRACLWLLNLH